MEERQHSGKSRSTFEQFGGLLLFLHFRDTKSLTTVHRHGDRGRSQIGTFFSGSTNRMKLEAIKGGVYTLLVE